MTAAIAGFSHCAIVHPLLATVIAELAETYPDALFIHTTRKVGMWLSFMRVRCSCTATRICVDDEMHIYIFSADCYSLVIHACMYCAYMCRAIWLE